MIRELRLLRREFAVQRQVIGAIMMRELVTRWGRRNLGFAWLILEPLVFALPVIAVWSYVRAPYEHGLPLVAFVWTGYMPLLVFRHVTSGALHAVRNSAALLYHRRVTPLDLFLGLQGLEALGNLASVVVSFTVLFSIGQMDLPYDYNLMLFGFVYTAWWSLSVALLVAALSERSEIVEHVWPPISYLYIFFSGFLLLADWIPESLRGFALAVDPPLHCYEIIRAGLFGPHFHSHYDIAYLTFMLMALTLLGLWLMSGVRRYIELE